MHFNTCYLLASDFFSLRTIDNDNVTQGSRGMTGAAKTHDSAATGQQFVAAIARRTWDELAACFDDTVQFRALTPKRLRSADDRT